MFISTLGLEKKDKEYLESLCKKEIRHCQINELTQDEYSEIEAVFSYGYDLPLEKVMKMKNLKWIHIGQSGMEYLPFQYLAEQEISVTNSKGINASNISEYVLSYMLSHVRKNDTYRQMQRKHIWDADTRMNELRDSTVGILGLGMAGKEVAKRAAAFDMHVITMDIFDISYPGVERHYSPDHLNEMLPLCDYIVLCLPLTKETEHIINRESLKYVKRGSMLINSGRGPLIDTDAVLDALKKGIFSKVVLDVFDREPLESDSQLWDFDENLIITPHIAGDHFLNYSKRMIEILAANLNLWPDKEKLINRVNVNSLI